MSSSSEDTLKPVEDSQIIDYKVDIVAEVDPQLDDTAAAKPKKSPKASCRCKFGFRPRGQNNNTIAGDGKKDESQIKAGGSSGTQGSSDQSDKTDSQSGGTKLK